MNSYEKLQLISKKNNSALCVGLDTDLAKTPEILGNGPEAIVKFNREIIEATKDLVSSYKINFAFYEQYGIEGFEALKQTFAMIPEHIFTIADAKRGDIGNTSASYAKSCFEYFGADSITVHPYMGRDSVGPFLDYKDKMIFLLALTSNPGSADFQHFSDGADKLYLKVIDLAKKWAGCSQLGFVVGATHPGQLAEIRMDTPSHCLLIPGIGAQGGDIEAVIKANNAGLAIINVSRGIIYASNGEDFAKKARERAEYYRAAINIAIDKAGAK